MHNWNTDIPKFKTKQRQKIWELEQKINYGIIKSKLSRTDLKKYLSQLTIDKDKRKFIEFILK